MGYFGRKNTHYDSENDLLREVFAPLINARCRTALRCCQPNDYKIAINILTNFHTYYAKKQQRFESESLNIFFDELCRQAENFIRVSTERGLL